ncbi:MAG: dienelactone hydrolase family protein [Candidatus Palauibacterales bacterium]|nr:dienelactone hydrolase family protein [Candidatus Palauibacterales bacterium]MDP2529549.1 dienelactone hydrolase family protein [Candidatus Palauibacterales bacterium]
MPDDGHDLLEIPGALEGPHAPPRVLLGGEAPERARAAAVLCHGRGGRPEDMQGLRRELNVPGVTFVAPGAAGSTWYPLPFIAPLEYNEPYLSSALALLGAVVAELERRGVPAERQLLLGFSQGGCLALEYAVRNARRYGAVAGLSAGLIGPSGTRWDFGGDLESTPVLLGCGDPDPHIPRDRLEETASVLGERGADVDLRVYSGLGHTVNRDELRAARALLEGMAGPSG